MSLTTAFDLIKRLATDGEFRKRLNSEGSQGKRALLATEGFADLAADDVRKAVPPAMQYPLAAVRVDEGATCISAMTVAGISGPADTAGISGPADTAGISGPAATAAISGPADTAGISGPADTAGISGPAATAAISVPAVASAGFSAPAFAAPAFAAPAFSAPAFGAVLGAKASVDAVPA
ncbi:hypothetical protein ABMY26_25110 [Azospirillum sp. HJ39]|uniref:hypothetical protein n=1 Tax=Azospirillum sp. HJ39 TaxID=3159496 RepID=UPI003557078B